MRYQAPFGVSDPLAPYINGNPAAGIQGSIPQAAAFEQPLRELDYLINISGFTASDGDLQQVAKSVQSQHVNYAVDTGTQNALVVTLAPALAGSYQPGLMVRVKVLHANISDATHTTLTLDAGLGPQPVIRGDGSLPLSNDLVAGQIANFIWDGTRFQIINFMGTGGGTGGGSTTYITKIPYAADTSATPGVITAAFTPAITTVAPGDTILVKLHNNIPGTGTTINVNALPAKPVVRFDGSPLGPLDGVVNEILWLAYDGAAYQLCNSFRSTQTSLTAPLDYYVNPTTGLDSNNGLSAATPFQTIQHALSVMTTIDTNGFAVTIHLAAGSYQPFNSVQINGSGSCTIVGNETTPSSCLINNTSGTPAAYFSHESYTVRGVKVQSNAAGSGRYGIWAQSVKLGLRNIDFGICSDAHLVASSSASVLFYGADDGDAGAFCTVSGSSTAHIFADTNGSVGLQGTICNISATVSIGYWLYVSQGAAVQRHYSSLSNAGAVSGQKFTAQMNGTINSGGMGVSYFPGNVAGTLASGGQYA